MNFDLAGEVLDADGAMTTTVLGTDDIASATPAEKDKRRGVAGIIYAYKCAGAAAVRGANLHETTCVAQKTVDSVRTIGCALGSCQIPGAAAPTFTLAANEIEMGMGIHGEPGIWRHTLKPADAIASEMVDRLLAELPPGSQRISVLVNGLGATPLEELFIVYRRVRQKLKLAGLEISKPLVGNFVTSMEMSGLSISLFALDAELDTLLAAPAECPFWKI